MKQLLHIIVAVILVVVSFVSVEGACSGSPKTLNGVPCASTTRYWDSQEGACGYVLYACL